MQGFDGVPEGKSPLDRHRHRWKNSIKMDFQAVGRGGINWINLAQDRDKWWALMNVVINFRVP
jgi:hypothetical protein